MSHDKTRHPESPESTSETRRGFSRGLGFLYQGVGAFVLMAMTCTCCVWSVFEGPGQSWLADDQAVSASASMENGIERRARTINAVLLVGTTAGAFCMVGFGLGMQTDRGWRPALGCALATLAMAVAYGWSAWMRAADGGGPVLVIVPVVLALCALGMSVLGWIAFAEVVREPPERSGPPTVPADAFPDPWAVAKPGSEVSGDQPLKKSIAKERARLQRELAELEEIEKTFEDRDSS